MNEHKKEKGGVWPRIPIALKIIEKHFNVQHNRAIEYLDLGCNDGQHTVMIREALCGRLTGVYGVDIDNDKLKKATKMGITTLNVNLSQDKLPFPDECFDIITSFEVVEHLFNPDNMLKEAHRILKPNGLFVLSTPNLASWLNRILLLIGYQPTYTEVSTSIVVGHFQASGSPLGHCRLFTLRALKALLEYYGFKILEVKGIGSKYPPKVIKVMDKLFAKKPSIARILIVACSKA